MSEQFENILLAIVILTLLFLLGSLLGLSFNPLKWEILLRFFWGISSAIVILAIVLNIIDP